VSGSNGISTVRIGWRTAGGVAITLRLWSPATFHDLGLVVIDEEQRFGAKDKAALREAAGDGHIRGHGCRRRGGSSRRRDRP
jgi:hypothetical protein